MIAKALLIIAVVLLLVWLLRGGRRTVRSSTGRPPAPPPAPIRPEVMTRCAHCGLHLPEIDAVRGPGGRAYCGEAHRRAAEDEGAGRSGPS